MTPNEIFEKDKEFYGKKFIDESSGKKYRYIGVLIDNEDYYYAFLSKKNGLRLVSCVIGFVTSGFKLVKE